MYEIVPEAGIRISKIKNLEDDIALSLAALGIRIIAPIPGKGTIGIEVPNNNPTMVSMKSVIASPKFQTAEMEFQMKKLGGEGPSFETIIASNYRSALPHGVASDKKIEKEERLQSAIDAIRNQFGFSLLQKGNALLEASRSIERSKLIGGHSAGGLDGLR